MRASGGTDKPMTLRELLETLKCFGVKIALHDGDTITIEPPDVLSPALRAALTEHHAALVVLIRSGPSSTSSFDTLLTGLDGVGARPAAEVLHERLRTLAAGLAGADPLVRELVRAEAIARLNTLGVRTPARIVDAALTARLTNSGGAGSGRCLLFADPEPWPEAVDGAALLDDLAHTYRRFVSLPDGGAEALALWIVLTYALDAFDVAPILALCSPLKRCGKTTTEDLTAALAKRALAAANITAAALYRTVEHFTPTLIVDEADTFLLNNLALRGIINSGHARATACVVRSIGHEPRLFSTWGARMIALIGRLPATLEDRQADNWRPLFAIADEAGGAWVALARSAARALSGTVVEADNAVPLQLLADLNDLFATTSADKLATADVIRHLITLEDRPWAAYAEGRPLTPRHLAQLLEGFRIKAKQIRQGAATRKGYLRSDFTDAFRRYLPPVPSESGTTGGCGGDRGSVTRRAVPVTKNR